MADNKITHTKGLAELTKDTALKIGDVYYRQHYDAFVIITKLKMSEYCADTVEVIYKYYEDGKFSDEEHSNVLKDFVENSILLETESGQSAIDAIKACYAEMVTAFTTPEKYLEIANNLESSEANGIIPVNQKDFYTQSKALLDAQSRRVAILGELMRTKMNSLNSVLHTLQEKIRKVSRIIGAIELYLGINEDIVQIQEGTPASIDEPISIRQMILYMDEEAAILENNGIDWRNVEEFDKWLCDGNHLQRVLPEKKGIIVLRASRQHKYDNDDPYYSAQMKNKNMYAYLLIRNGDNLYRIWTNIHMGERFFPTLEESAKIEAVFEKAMLDGYYSEKNAEKDKFGYLRNTLLVQGLIDRTDLFLPLKNHIDFFAPNTYAPDGPIRMIRDDEMQLPSGRVSYANWRKSINMKIDRGSRIFFPGIRNYSQKEDAPGRFIVYRNWYPNPPQPGMYTIEELHNSKFSTTGHTYRIKYLPTEMWKDYERKVSFILYSDEILNYDMISLEDLEYYIEDRAGRSDFLNMLPVLIGMKKMRLQEIEDEKGFVTLVSNKLGISEKKVWKAIDWWKYKVIWKRPIRKDDAKAWRMISKRLTGKEEVYFSEEES